jgi:hypothetical protein
MADFRFKGIDGRGSQTLVRDPQSGGAAVVRIEDPQSGSEGYTFDLIWHEGTPPDPRPTGAFVRDNHDRDDHDRDNRNRGDHVDNDRFDHDRLPPQEVVQICRDEVRQEAVYQFSCSVNFGNGRVRSVDIDPWDGRR